MTMPVFKSTVHRMLRILIPTFGERVRYIPADGSGEFTRMAVFDRNFHQVDPDTEALIASNLPAIGVNLNDWPKPPEQGDKVKIISTGETFTVNDSQEDGQGGATLMLTNVTDDDEAT